MAEDVIEFGPMTVAERPQPRRFRRGLPPMLTSPATVVFALGCVATVLSFAVPWQTTSLPDGDTVREVGAALAATGPIGAAFVVVAAAAITAGVLALFGQPSVRSTSRLIGISLCACGLGIVGSMGYSLSRTSNLADFRLFSEADLGQVKFGLEWGIYLAAAGLAGVAAALVASLRPTVVIASGIVPEQAYEAEPLELEVSVHPANPKASPGPGHEIYLRP